MKVLHICCHLGGGVGTSIKNLVENTSSDIKHTVACLNHYDSRSVLVDNCIQDLRNDYEKLSKLIINTDIVLFHWYNNPILYEFLITFPIPPCRFIVWALANNLYPPYVTPKKLIDISDRFILSSGVTQQSKEYQELLDKQKEKIDIIWAVADMTKFFKVKRIPHDTFNIGYAGTIDFNSKMHPDFVELCSDINIPNVKFIVCSNGPDLNKVKQQVKDKGLWDKFIFTGRVEDLSEWFAQMDVFGYPLYEKHYGTSEQVLGEAMAAGAVPVVLNNPPEYLIVNNNFNGIIACKNNYSKEIENLYKNPELLKKLSENARQRSKELYDTNIMVTQWETEFKNIIKIKKNKKLWHGANLGSVLFKEALAEYGEIFDRNNKNEIIEFFKLNKQWYSESKGSIHQYAMIYPEDKKLQVWKKILDEISG